jgi:polyhydroxyalkanoate synthesis regulator phasin
MNIDTRKISLAKQVLSLNNEEVLKAFEDLLKEAKLANYESNLKPKSLDQYKDEMRLAIQDEKAERLTKATDLKEQIRGWN